MTEHDDFEEPTPEELAADEALAAPPEGTVPIEIVLRSNMRSLVDAYYASQKNRISWSNRVSALERGVDNPEAPVLLQAAFYRDQFQTIEKRAFSELKQELKTHPVWPWLQRVKGVGPTLAGKVLCDIDIHKAKYVSSLWSFAGYGVTPEGKAPRPVKGEKLKYSAKLRTACFMVSRSFLMSKSPYTQIYHAKKEFYTLNRGTADYLRDGVTMPKWTKGHCDFAARRAMVKIFLSHLWVKWREAEGLAVSLPYPQAKLGPNHQSYMSPEMFVPELTTVEN